jgi:glucose/arabinose dehydrogenase/mono/diheme cytochrome c family protein
MNLKNFQTLLALLILALAGAAHAQTPKAKRASTPRPAPPSASWVEPDFPFFSTVLDGRRAGVDLAPDNLAPRSIVLNLGRDCWLAFDPDLLRVAAIWRGRGVTPVALAPGTYLDIGYKTSGGQSTLPEPEGEVWLANGIYPGWQAGETIARTDPREPAPSPEEVGRGAIDASLGRFEAVRLTAKGAVLDYHAAGARVREWAAVSEPAGQPVVERHFDVAGSARPLTLALGVVRAGFTPALALRAGARAAKLERDGSLWIVRVPAGSEPANFCVTLAPGGTAPAIAFRTLPEDPPPRRWLQEVAAKVNLSTERAAYVVDKIELPVKNSWQRAVRPGDVQFLPDGTGLMVTLDGDVWTLHGLDRADGAVRWRRFASGLHEPMSLAVRDGEIFVFDKNGIWRLRDTDGNGEADVHEMFSNAFAQTADQREFATTLRLGPGGEFVIAKGGQEDATIGKHNGSVLRISADGRRATVLGYGFRQPSIGVNPRTGLVTSSDQQGQYVPSTPLHIVRDRQFYGFISLKLPKEKYPAPIADPLTWIPHAVNTSAMSQVWLFGARLGPLNDALVHIAFNKPELFRVLLNERGGTPQAAVVSITRNVDYPLLNGSVNPVDGMLYVAGFHLPAWANIAHNLIGLGRLRYTGAPVTIPREVVPMDQGVLLRFDTPLDPRKAADPASYSLQSWNYVRSYKYGSAQYKADGSPGQDSLPASSAYLSRDRRSVFVGVPGMKPVMQLRIGWSLATADGMAFEENAYTTPYELVPFRPEAEGFDAIKVDLTPKAAVAQAAVPVTVEEGRRLAQLFACVACHATEEINYNRAGPKWIGLHGTQRPVVLAGRKVDVTADNAYLRESMLDPTAKIALGFEKGEYAMPSYSGVLSDPQIDAIILYIRSLAK